MNLVERMAKTSKILTELPITDSFNVTQLDQQTVDTAYSNRLSYHRILFIASGTGGLVIDDHSFEVSGAEVFLLAKGQVYQFTTPSMLTGYVVSFGDCFWEKTPQSASNCKAVLFNNAAANQRLQPTDAELNALGSLFHTLLAEHQAAPYTNQLDTMAAYLKIIMIKLANIKMTADDRFDSQDYILYRKFMELLSAQYRHHHAVNNYAEQLNLTARRLSELCKRCSNSSAKELINGQIVAEAKRSLQFGSSPVKEIAHQLHFHTPEQFSHFFKKQTNIAPADYRNQFLRIGT